MSPAIVEGPTKWSGARVLPIILPSFYRRSFQLASGKEVCSDDNPVVFMGNREISAWKTYLGKL